MQKEILPQLDITWFPSQLFWLAVTFTVLYVVLSRGILPQIHDVLERRKNRIEDDLDRAESLHKEAENVRVVYEQTLGETKAQARGLLLKAATQVEEQQQAAVQELERTLNAQIEEAEQRISATSQKVWNQARPVAEEISAQIVQKILHTAPESSGISSAVETALKTR